MQRPPSGIPAARQSTATFLPGPSVLLHYAERLRIRHPPFDQRFGQLATAADRLRSVEGVSARAVTAGMDSRQRTGIEMRHDDETAHLTLFEGPQERLVVLE